MTNILEGAGVISANGGDGYRNYGGGGSGGRIAINVVNNNFIGSVEVSGGLGYESGKEGTVNYGQAKFGCGDAFHPHPVGDLYPDCKIDFRDFAILAEHWLENTMD